MAGREDVESIQKYNGQIARFSDDGKVFRGAYGPRLRDQWKYLISLLKKDSHSRQAVATIYTPCPEASKDIPCTLSFQVFIRDGKLHGIVTMRSSDIWLGLPYDFFNFSMIANCLACKLCVTPGSLTFQLGSSHLYAENAFNADEVIRTAHITDHVASPIIKDWPNGSNTDEYWDLCDIAEAVFSPDPNGLYLGAPWSRWNDVLHVATNKAEAFKLLKSL